jgi:hypothetical protein
LGNADYTEDYTAQERAALVAWHLAHGEVMTTAEVASVTGLSWAGAWHLMNRLSRVLPIYRDESGVWAVCVLNELIYAGASL